MNVHLKYKSKFIICSLTWHEIIELGYLLLWAAKKWMLWCCPIQLLCWKISSSTYFRLAISLRLLFEGYFCLLTCQKLLIVAWWIFRFPLYPHLIELCYLPRTLYVILAVIFPLNGLNFMVKPYFCCCGKEAWWS